MQAGRAAPGSAPAGSVGEATPRTEPAPVDRADHARPAAPQPKSGRAWLGQAAPVEINLDALRATGILPPVSEQRQLADQYRTIKRPLIKYAFDPAERDRPDAATRRSIIVTSALPGDGKTFTAINLALSLSREQDHSVLLVDADVAKRDVSTLFGISNRAGLLDVLADRARAIESVIAPTSVPGFSVLPAGRYSSAATELLASARMQDVMSSLTALDPQCLIVLDSPPILLTTEAPVLASQFGHVLVVVKACETPQRALLAALRIIGRAGHVSLVLNGADVAGPSGYRDGSRYGYGYHDSAAEMDDTNA
jgi:exopolysaccharide/PEP-CTERM locus tyrosine autokinase